MNELTIANAEGRGLSLRDEPRMPPPPRADRIDLRWFLATLRRRRRMIVGIALAVLAAALVLTALMTPVYVASTRVVLNVARDSIAPRSGTAPVEARMTQDVADTEIEVLKSRGLAERTADALLRTRPQVAAALASPHPGALGRVKALVLGAPPVPIDAVARREAVIEAVQSRSNVTRTGMTYAVNVAFAAQDPQVAAAGANAIADVYTRGQYEDKRAENQGATRFLAGRLEQLRAQANADNAAVQRYRIANNLLSTSGASLTEQEISTYNQRVADARTQASGDRAALQTARAQLRNGSNGGDVGEALGSSVVSGLRARRAEVSGRLAVLNARYGDLNPDVIKTRSELADVDEQIADEIKRVVSNLEAKVQVSEGRLGAISGSLSGARGTLAQNNRAAVQLDDLSRRADASQQMYESYLNRYKELSAQEGTEKADARTISTAVPPRFPTSPNMPLNAALGLFLGIGAGIASAFAAEMGFAGLTSRADVETRLGQQYLGATPLVRRRDVAGLADMPVDRPNSLFSQSLRNLKATMTYAGRDGGQVFALASALPGEGKTTTSIALARSIALAGDTCVVVDCDFRRRSMSKVVETSDVGLVEVLGGSAPLDRALVRDGGSGAWMLPIVGDADARGALLTGGEMDRLLEELRARFRYVVLDTPPVLPVPETREILAKADAAVMLVRWRRTPDHAVSTALHMLPSAFVDVVGVVLSAVNVSKAAGGGVGDPAYYHRQYQEYLK